MFLCRSVYAQNVWEWNFSIGSTLYFGDLGNEKYIPVSEMHQGISVGIQRNLFYGRKPSPFAVSAQLIWMRIGYDETQPLLFNTASGNDLRNFRRGLNFRNDLVGLDTRFIYTFDPWNNQAFSYKKFALYFFVGAGIFYSDPRADLFRGDMHLANRYYYWDDGTLRNAPQGDPGAVVVARDGEYETRLRQWYTEGQGRVPFPGQKGTYSQFQIGFPHGGGIQLGLSKTSVIRFEACFFDFPFTDYMDDASDRYATYEEIERNFPSDLTSQELAKYITDPSGLGSDGENGPYSSPRGNPKKFDWVNYMNVQFSFDIGQGNKQRSYKSRLKKGKGCPTF